MSNYTTKNKAQLNVNGASIDAYYGPWSSRTQFESWLSDTVGMSSIPEGVTIAVKNANGTITKYVRENATWREDGAAADVTKSYVDTQLTSYATKAYVASAISDAGIPSSASITAKADKTYVDTELAKKADTSTVTAKADKTYVDTELAKKADTSTVTAKADKSYVDTELAKKQDVISDLSTIRSNAQTAVSTASAAQTAVAGKQAQLVSGTNIKTVNGQTILGSGNIECFTSAQEAKIDSAISKVDTFNETLEEIGSSSTDAVVSAQASKISALETKITKIEDIQTSDTSSKILVGDSQADPTIKVESKKTYVYGKLYLNDAELTNTQSSGSSSERTFYPIIGTPSLYKSASISKTDISSSKVADLIYPIYDTLCTNYPRIIKRLADFGTGYNNQPIRHYQIKCTNPVVNTTEGSLEGNVWDDALYGNKKIFINAGTHGDEKSSTYGMALAVKDIVESNDDWARFLKGNFTIDIIPCLYPYGYDANTRTYPNGTNINRDYDNKTTPEATIVRNYINTNKSNLACALDSHNTVLKLSFMEVVPTYSKFNQYSRIANNLAMSLLPELETIYNDTSLYPYIYMVKSSHYGTFAAMVNDLGVTGHTVEAPRDVNDGGNTNYTNSCELTKNFMINLMIAYGYDYLNNL